MSAWYIVQFDDRGRATVCVACDGSESSAQSRAAAIEARTGRRAEVRQARMTVGQEATKARERGLRVPLACYLKSGLWGVGAKT